ncbi:YggT family protein [Fructilactobacillus sp. Tb1]|uniref:YggT family protein n=1 Tax=Fructilactobacillus sp. Tb1 TaxID=3422304 RepID=UPI003D2E3B60
MITVINLIGTLLYYAINIYIFLIVIWALLSWFPGASESKLGQLINRVVEPFLNYFNFIHIGMIGLGPMVAIIALWFIQYGVVGITNFLINLMI